MLHGGKELSAPCGRLPEISAACNEDAMIDRHKCPDEALGDPHADRRAAALRPSAALDASAQQLRRRASRLHPKGAATAVCATVQRADCAVRRALDSFLRWGYPISRLSAPRSL